MPDYEEEILKAMAKRGKQPNISFFAFTATPKYKTLEVFGQLGPDGKPQPFHLYSMRQQNRQKGARAHERQGSRGEGTP